MKIIISPAKTMQFHDCKNMNLSIPFFDNEVNQLISLLKSLTIDEIINIMKVNQEIAKTNKKRFEEFKFDKYGVAAIYAYNGIQYKNIDIENFDDKDMEYLNSTVRILSGLYGVLKPFDSIYEYRLEMKTTFKTKSNLNLYNFWNDKVFKYLTYDNEIIINLASQEYSKLIEKFIKKENFITCIFKIGETFENLRTNSTDAKKLRGQMINFIIKNKVKDHNLLRGFSFNNYKYCQKLSNENTYYFVKNISNNE